MASTYTSGDDAMEILTLRDAMQFFWRQSGPRVLMLASFGFMIARVAAGVWTRTDFFVAIAVAITWHLQERLLHEYFLHMKAQRLLGATLSKRLSIHHRQHHRDPWRTQTLFIATRAYMYTIPLVVGTLLGLTRDIQLTLTGSFAYFFTLLCYEWTHCLIHTSYVPQSEWYRRRWWNHRLHHFQDSRHWFGITSPFWDALLGSKPDPSRIKTRKNWRGSNPLA
ncbi:MAG TPA: sterol desaturase family protein [Thermoanaerobaculia bacterium]|nr:sterol desaturase family protein [Thermoanaerobaculia bacterium]